MAQTKTNGANMHTRNEPGNVNQSRRGFTGQKLSRKTSQLEIIHLECFRNLIQMGKKNTFKTTGNLRFLEIAS